MTHITMNRKKITRGRPTLVASEASQVFGDWLGDRRVIALCVFAPRQGRSVGIQCRALFTGDD